MNHPGIILPCGLLAAFGGTSIKHLYEIAVNCLLSSCIGIMASSCIILPSSFHPPAIILPSAMTGVKKMLWRGHHPGIILPLLWADVVILASSCKLRQSKSKFVFFGVLLLGAVSSSYDLG